MYPGVCVCILLAVLFTGSLCLSSQPMGSEVKVTHSDSLPPPSPDHTRQTRSASAPSSGQAVNYNQLPEDTDLNNSLSQLLARLMTRKGSLSQTRSSVSSRASGVGPSHRIKDRDYLGWMDFGRRSAEEYEYSP